MRFWNGRQSRTHDCTALMYAAGGNTSAAVLEVLLGAGAELEARDENGSTPLMWAASNSESQEVIGSLISAGADLEARDNGGWTALMHAVSFSETADVAQVLLDAGADWSSVTDEGDHVWDLIEENRALRATQVRRDVRRLRFR